jgi:hypothetical protein
MAQRRRKPAKRAKPRLRPVRDAGKARLLAPAYHDAAALGGERGGHAVDQARAFIERLRLIAAEASRLTAGENGAENDQSNASVACPSVL